MNKMNLLNLLAETTNPEPLLEVVGFILMFGSFALGVFFVYQVVYYAIVAGKAVFGATQKSKGGKIMASPLVSIPVALVVGGIVLYLLTAYGVIDLVGIVESIAKWFETVFTK
ncbi:MAG: hypothetical protein IKA72_02865 [Clostridia bacterium]|nr:hypothetical protein [Clostridia bacterium]